MSEHEARGRAVYDHDEEEPRPSGRRRRPAADWGVGEEIFDHMPRRRFERRPGDHIPRGGAADGRRTIQIGDDVPPVDERRPRGPADEEFASRDDAIRAREEHEAVWGGDEPFVPSAAASEPAPVPAVESEPRGPGDGRRTVRIGGRPGEFATPSRRRPSRTIDERIGSRPDRVAAWAVALGFLLILIALLV